jgi:hypothetical protein
MTEEWPAYPGLPPTGGFTADPTTAPTLRASNADCAHAAALLDGAYAEGGYRDRAGRTLVGVTAAVTLGDRAPLVADVTAVSRSVLVVAPGAPRTGPLLSAGRESRASPSGRGVTSRAAHGRG